MELVAGSLVLLIATLLAIALSGVMLQGLFFMMNHAVARPVGQAAPGVGAGRDDVADERGGQRLPPW